MTAKKIQRADVCMFLDKVEFREAALLSYVTSAIIVPCYADIKRDFGIIRAEYLLLLCLSHFAVLTAQDVSRLTGRPRNSISRAVNRMLKLGYLRRAPDPHDGRQLKLSITASGRRQHKKIAAHMTLSQENILSALSTSERQVLESLLLKAVNHTTARRDGS